MPRSQRKTPAESSGYLFKTDAPQSVDVRKLRDVLIEQNGSETSPVQFIDLHVVKRNTVLEDGYWLDGETMVIAIAGVVISVNKAAFEPSSPARPTPKKMEV